MKLEVETQGHLLIELYFYQYTYNYQVDVLRLFQILVRYVTRVFMGISNLIKSVVYYKTVGTRAYASTF